MKTIIAVIDTNVLVSGMISNNPSSPTVGVLKCVDNKTIVPLFCDEILHEYDIVLHRKKFNLPEDEINAVLDEIVALGLSSSRITSNEQFPDPKDVVFYEIALSKENSYLIAGKIKHFPKVDFVVTPAEIMKIIEENTTK